MKKSIIYLTVLIFILSFIGCTRKPKAPQVDTEKLIEEMEMITELERNLEQTTGLLERLPEEEIPHTPIIEEEILSEEIIPAEIE